MSNASLVISIGVITRILASADVALAQEQFDFERFSGPTSKADQAISVQSRMTNEASRSFEIGSNGIAAEVRPVEQHPLDSDRSGLVHRGASYANSPAPAASSPNENPDFISLAKALPNLECGPSPLAPEAIERLVAEAALRHSIDPQFATAIAWAESRYDQVRNSPKGARGPMQLMPGTAKRFGVTDICDPASNIEGGVRYLRALLDEFKNPMIAAAAYNAGEQSIYDKGGFPAYPETVNYVASVINRQLGVNFSRKRPGANRKPSSKDEPARAPDVIGVRPPKFVSGVMQF